MSADTTDQITDEGKTITEKYDVAILGIGPAGKLLGPEKRVAIGEREIIGGERAYWACVPSKT